MTPFPRERYVRSDLHLETLSLLLQYCNESFQGSDCWTWHSLLKKHEVRFALRFSYLCETLCFWVEGGRNNDGSTVSSSQSTSWLWWQNRVKNLQILKDRDSYVKQDSSSSPQPYISLPKAAAQLFVFKEESSDAESHRQLLPVTHASLGWQEPLPPLQSQLSISLGLWPALLERGVFDFKSCHQMSPLAHFDSGQLDYRTRPSSSLCCHAIYLNRLNMR